MTLVFITGLVYACALRPRVVTDSAAITVRNPLRDHRIPWGSVAAVDLRESVQVHCVREPGAKRGKIIYSWALYAHRRNRLRQQLLAQGDRRRLPRSALDVLRHDGRHGREDREAERGRDHGHAAGRDGQGGTRAGRGRGPRAARWSWQPALAIVAPAIALVLVGIVLLH